MAKAYCAHRLLATLEFSGGSWFNGLMKAFRIMVVLLLALFTADVVQAAPSELLMQLAGQSVPADMPCHQDHADSHPDQQAGADSGQCHACFACVKLVTAPADLVVMPPAGSFLVAHPQAIYQTRFSAPALRPPIPA